MQNNSNNSGQEEIKRVESKEKFYDRVHLFSYALIAAGMITAATSPFFLIRGKAPEGYSIYKNAENTLIYLKSTKENLNKPKSEIELLISYKNPIVKESLVKIHGKDLEKISHIDDAIASIEKDVDNIKTPEIIKYEKGIELAGYRFLKYFIIGGSLTLLGIFGGLFSICKWTEYHNKLEKLKIKAQDQNVEAKDLNPGVKEHLAS